MNEFKIIGIAGLILISLGMIVSKRTLRDLLSFFGGVGLLIYSIYLKDFIFIVLQSVYILVVTFDFIKEKNQK
jgi:lipid-A-disaccharide synthase-like uncharacterized protein